MSTVNRNSVNHSCCCIGSAYVQDAPTVWPLRSDNDYRRAVEIVDRLAVKGEENLTDAERDRLDIFSTLIEAYEDAHHRIAPPELSPVEFLEKLMEESGMSTSDLGRLLGDRSLGYRILGRERSLSKKHVKILSEHFKIDPSALLA